MPEDINNNIRGEKLLDILALILGGVGLILTLTALIAGATTIILSGIGLLLGWLGLILGVIGFIIAIVNKTPKGLVIIALIIPIIAIVVGFICLARPAVSVINDNLEQVDELSLKEMQNQLDKAMEDLEEVADSVSEQ